MTTTHILKYNTTVYLFREAIQIAVGKNQLEFLHIHGNPPSETVKPGSDNHTQQHQAFYDRMKEPESYFMRTYDRFLSTYIRPLYDGPIIVQRYPTFRIHWHGNLGVGAYHKDSEYNHYREETNYWLPVTQAFDTNTIWIESAEDKGDYKPQPVMYGEVFVFPGSRLKHGNELNRTGQTRVSFDFRVIPESDYKEPAQVKRGFTFGKAFKVGDYFRRVE